MPEEEVSSNKIPDAPEDWTAVRAQGIGGSEIGAIIGLSRWRSAMDVWLDKTGRASPQEETPSLHWGKALEEVIAREYASRTGNAVSAGIALSRGICRGFTDRMAVTPAGDHVLVEIKTSSAHCASEWGPDGSDEVPATYLAQVQWYLALLPDEYQRADLAVLIGGSDYRCYHIARDRQMGEALQAAAEAFWREHVLADVPPETSSAEDKRSLVTALYTHDTGEMRTATAEVEQLMDEYEAALAAQADADAKVEALKTSLQEIIGDASGIEGVCGRRATWKTQESRRFDAKKAKTFLSPEQARECEKVSVSRVFRFVKAKKIDTKE